MAAGGGGPPPRGEGVTRAEGPLPRYCHEPRSVSCDAIVQLEISSSLRIDNSANKSQNLRCLDDLADVNAADDAGTYHGNYVNRSRATKALYIL
jgi:hypothetical protein